MFRWIAILAAIVLVVSVAYGQSSNEQPTMPLDQGQMMGMPGMMMAGGFLDQMDERLSHLQARRAALKAIRDPAAALYRTLNPTQKQKADTAPPMSLCM